MGVCAGSEDYRRLAAAGHELACHTDSHLDCGRASGSGAKADVERNVETLAAWGAPTLESFAYPYGDRPAVSPREHQLAKDLGFRVAVTTEPGTLSARSFDAPTTLPRISLNGLYQKPKYVGALASGIPFKLMRR